MGLILPQTVKVKIASPNYNYFKEKGYEFEKCGDIIEVNVLDLQKVSTVMVKCTCDFCGKITKMWYGTVIRNKENNTLIACDDKNCIRKKKEDTTLKRYGVKNPSQAQEIKNKKVETCKKNFGCDYPAQSQVIQDKMKEAFKKNFGCDNPMQNANIQNKAKATNIKRYGVENVAQSKTIQDRMKATCKERYGVENAAQSKTIQDKMKATCKERYGVESAIQSKAIQDKMKSTNLERYGVENAMQNEEIKNKALDSFQFNGTGPCSRTQKYIHFLIGGTLNKRVCSSLVDICFEEEKIAIEYDGSGHFLSEFMVNEDRSISKEAILREKNRENSIVNKGYKMIRFIAKKDRIPSDEMILKLVNYISDLDFKVIRVDFEESAIEKDYNKKMIYDFGKLRRITQKDLEEIESKKIINLK